MKRFLALMLALMLAISAFGCGKENNSSLNNDGTTASGSTDATDNTKDTDATGDATDATDSGDDTPKEGIYLRDSYSVSDDEAMEQGGNVVATVGENALTNNVLQIYYWSGIYSFLNEYGSYIYYYGLDPTQPLDEQTQGEDGSTWQHFFLDEALILWHRYQALAIKNNELNLELRPELQQELDETVQLLKDSAEAAEYDSVDAMLTKEMGAGATVDGYLEYSRLFYQSYNYYLHMYDQLEITDQQIEAYFEEHKSELEESGLTKETLQYDVRHILIVPEGGTEDENGTVTYTDAEMEACKDEAQKLLDQWLADNPTEESFAALAKAYSEDPGSAENGGLYEGLTEQTNFVESFKAWYLDDTRQPGDTGLVKSDYGYHIMYFSSSETAWQEYCKESIAYEECSEFIDAAMEEYPMEMNIDLIALPVVTLS